MHPNHTLLKDEYPEMSPNELVVTVIKGENLMPLTTTLKVGTNTVTPMTTAAAPTSHPVLTSPTIKGGGDSRGKGKGEGKGMGGNAKGQGDDGSSVDGSVRTGYVYCHHPNLLYMQARIL